MPTYDYRCRKCGHRFELFHRITDETPKRCPRCRGRAGRVPAGGAGLLFKGSGFHVTDYRSRSYREKARGEKGDGKTPGGKGEGKPPAEKSEGRPPAEKSEGRPPAERSEGRRSAEKSEGRPSGGKKDGGGEKKSSSAD